MKHVLFSITSALIFLPITVFAGGVGEADNLLRDVGDGANVGEIDITTAIGAGLSIALSMVGLIFLILMVYAGFTWLTARGEEGQVDKARKTIIAATIGLVIVVSSYALTVFVGSQF